MIKDGLKASAIISWFSVRKYAAVHDFNYSFITHSLTSQPLLRPRATGGNNYSKCHLLSLGTHRVQAKPPVLGTRFQSASEMKEDRR